MRITAAVMAHPRRKEAAEDLERQLKAMPFEAVAIVYNELGEEVTPHEREWDTGTRSLKWGLGKGDWHLVIQDDAILTPGFFENLTAAIEALPQKTLISLYTGKARPWPKRISTAVKRAADGDWLRFYILLWGVAIVIPTDHILPMLDFVEDRTEPYDTRVGIFYQRNMMSVYYTMPSLVDHNDDVGSLLGHGVLPGARVAHRPATGPFAFTGNIVDM